MDSIDNLTNEEISKKFVNQFDLVNYAIGLATDMIRTGRDPRVKMNTENPALLILEEIAEGKDVLVEASCEKIEVITDNVTVEIKQVEIEEEVVGEEESSNEEEETQEVLTD